MQGTGIIIFFSHNKTEWSESVKNEWIKQGYTRKALFKSTKQTADFIQE